MTPEQRKEYLVKVGKPGRSVLDIIDKLRPYIQAMESEIGQALLEEDINAHAALLNKIYTSIIETGTAEQKDAILLQLIHARLDKIYKKLQSYTDCVGVVKSHIDGRGK